MATKKVEDANPLGGDTRNILAKCTDSRKFMIALLVEAVGLGTNKFFALGIPPVHLWYGTIALFVVVMVLIAMEDIAKIKSRP